MLLPLTLFLFHKRRVHPPTHPHSPQPLNVLVKITCGSHVYRRTLMWNGVAPTQVIQRGQHFSARGSTLLRRSCFHHRRDTWPQEEELARSGGQQAQSSLTSRVALLATPQQVWLKEPLGPALWGCLRHSGCFPSVTHPQPQAGSTSGGSHPPETSILVLQPRQRQDRKTQSP